MSLHLEMTPTSKLKKRIVINKNFKRNKNFIHIERNKKGIKRESINNLMKRKINKMNKSNIKSLKQKGMKAINSSKVKIKIKSLILIVMNFKKPKTNLNNNNNKTKISRKNYNDLDFNNNHLSRTNKKIIRKCSLFMDIGGLYLYCICFLQLIHQLIFLQFSL